MTRCLGLARMIFERGARVPPTRHLAPSVGGLALPPPLTPLDHAYDSSHQRVIVACGRAVHCSVARMSLKSLVVCLPPLLPLPSQVTEYSMEFSMAITGNTATQNQASSASGWSASGGGGWWGWGSTGSARVSSSSSSSSTSNVQQTFHMNVKVKAVQDDMPAGLATVLNLLEAGFITGMDSNPTGVVHQ